MRIFMLVQHETIRGPVGKHTPHLVAALRSLGSMVVTHPWGRERDKESLSAKVPNRLRDVISVARAVREQDFDVVVVQSAHDWRTLIRDIAGVLAVKRQVRPVVIQLHGSQASRLAERGHRPFKLATAALLALVDGVLVLSTEEQRQWQAFRSRPRVFAVKNPYVRKYSSVAREAGETPGERPRVLFVGRLTKEKGVFDLVEAIPHVLARADCDLVVVGDGGQERKLRDQIRRLGLEDRVTMTGYLAGSDLSGEYARATILVLPSWSEGFPTVLAEAMDAGLAIVTTRIRGAVDHLADGENALFVEPRDVNGLASALVALLQDRDLRTKMAAANRERVRLFDPELVGTEYLQVLQSIIGERAGRKSLSQGDRRSGASRPTTGAR
jgi:glycosyltransferase involved in cell wall biosynthesis